MGAAAQTPDPATTISAAAIARDVAVLASDSMWQTPTSTRGVEAAARYVAARFAQAGLRSGGDLIAQLDHPGWFGQEVATWFQRYRIPVDLTTLSLVFTLGAQRVAAPLPADGYLPRAKAPLQPATASVLWVSGRPTPAALQAAHPEAKIVLYTLASSWTPDSVERVLGPLMEQSRALVFLHHDSAAFARRVQEEASEYVTRSAAPQWVAATWAPAVPGLPALLAAAGIDLARLRTDTTAVVRDVPALQVALAWQRPPGAAQDTATTAPNVIGFLEGSDSVLKHEFVILSAELAPLRPDGDSTGAAAQAARVAGTAGLLALARAFSQPGARPRRSILFLATSGGEAGFWGSRAFIYALFDWMAGGGVQPVLPYIASLRLGPLSGAPPDSVAVDGGDLLELAVPPSWVATAHPELGLTVVDGADVLRLGSEDAVFTRAVLAVPRLTVHVPGRPEGPSAVATAAQNAEQAARVTRFAFYMAQGVLNTKQPPTWNAAGRKELLLGP